MEGANTNEVKAQNEKLMINMQAILDNQKTTADDVKNMRDATSEQKSAHENAIADLKAGMDKLETLTARKPNVSDEKGLAPENIKRFENVIKQIGQDKSVRYDASQASALKKAYDAALTFGYERITPEQKTLVNTIISTEGGYLTVPEYDQELINKKHEARGILSLIDIKNTGSGTLHQNVDVSDYDSWDYLNELANTDPDEHEPDYKRVTWNATEQIFKFRISRSELEDSVINVETDIIGKAREGAMRQTAAQVMVGNGIDRPKGLLAYADGTNYDEIERVTSNTAATMKWIDVLNILPKQLIGPYHDNASYLMKRQSFFDLLTDVDGAGQFAIMNQINFFSGEKAGMFIMGKPVVFDAGLQLATTGGNESVIYGDFQQAYRLIERVGFSLIIDDKTSGQDITYRLRRRNDGKLRMGHALKVLKMKS